MPTSHDSHRWRSATCSAPTPGPRCGRHEECHEQRSRRGREQRRGVSVPGGAGMQQFVGTDWATRRARWCAVTPAGAPSTSRWAPADEDSLAGLVIRLGPEASACLEMMSGTARIYGRLQAAGCKVQIADARKARAVGWLAAKTDGLDARVLAELARRDLVPPV